MGPAGRAAPSPSSPPTPAFQGRVRQRRQRLRLPDLVAGVAPLQAFRTLRVDRPAGVTVACPHPPRSPRSSPIGRVWLPPSRRARAADSSPGRDRSCPLSRAAAWRGGPVGTLKLIAQRDDISAAPVHAK